MEITADRIISLLRLSPHPEGGHYAETYRAPGIISPPLRRPGDSRPAAPRTICTAIYFLLQAGEISRIHRIESDEIWHYYIGGAMRVVEITPDGAAETTLVGPDVAAGQTPQHVVAAGNWLGASPAPGTGFSLVGCTVAPGFEFDDLTMADREDLLARYPDHSSLIREFTSEK